MDGVEASIASLTKLVLAKLAPAPATEAWMPGVDEMLAANARRGLEIFDKARLSNTEFAMEWLTVAVNNGRKAGHSTYIAKHADKRDCVVVATKADKARFIERFLFKGVVVTAGELKRAKPNCAYGQWYRVFVDNPTLVLKHISKEGLYSAFVTSTAIPQFILLGQ